MRRKLTITLVVIVALMAMVTSAQAIDPFIGYFVLGQMINDQRQLPTQQDVLGLNPMYNVYMDGKFLGANPEPKTIVSSVAQGSTLRFEPGNIGRVDIYGFELWGGSEQMAEKIGQYADPKTAGKYFPDGKAIAKEVHAEVGETTYVSGHPRYAKWGLSVCTKGWPQGMYLVKLRTWFLQRKNSGFLNLGRETIVQREETIIRFVVLDQEYMQAAVNDVQVQEALRTTYGLIAGPTQISKLRLSVNPEMIEQPNKPRETSRGLSQSASGQEEEREEDETAPPAPKKYIEKPAKAQKSAPAFKPHAVTLIIMGLGSEKRIRTNVEYIEDELYARTKTKHGLILDIRRGGRIVASAEIVQYDGRVAVAQGTGSVLRKGDAVDVSENQEEE